jgi:ribosomal protein S18 acetylase RimI-like enzyme
MDDVAIRPLQPDDCNAAGRIVASNELWSERYQYPAERVQHDLAESLLRGDTVLGAFGGPRRDLLGFAWVIAKGAFGRYPYLRLLAVSSEVQGGGVGAQLLAEAEARSRDSRQMVLMVSDFNTRAQKFYARCGYAQVGTCPDFVIDGVAEQIWMKRLP